MIYKNTASQKAIYFAFDATTNVPKTGDAANITPYVSKDYGAVTAVTDTSATEMDATNAPGYYLVDLTQGETNAEVLLLSAKSSTSNIKVIGAPAVIFTMPTTGVLSPATLGRTLVVDASGLADANMVKAGPTGSGTAQTAGDIIGDTNDIQTRLPAALVSGRMDSSVGAITAGVVAAIWDALTSGMSAVGSIGKKLADWTVGTIDTYTGNTKQTGDAYARLGAPAGASVSADVAAVKVDTAAILVDTGTTLDGRIPAALVGGKMDASVGAVAAGVDFSATMKASINTEALDVLATDTYAEPGQGAPAATTTLAAKINYLFKAWRNKKEKTATASKLYDDAGTTVDQKTTDSDDGTTGTRGEVASGP